MDLCFQLTFISSSLNRHMERFEDKGFDTELLSSEKVVGDASQDNLGVPSSIFHEVYLFYLNSSSNAHICRYLSSGTRSMSSSILLGDGT